jgi:hypothetical protein
VGGARWFRALTKAWTREIKSGGAYKLTLGELIERCIRAGIVAIGERWPEEKPGAIQSRRAAWRGKRQMDEQPLWSVDDVATYLNLRSVYTVGNMVRAGRITKADGLIKVGRLTRFYRNMVISRVQAGLFGRGLELDGDGGMAAAAPDRKLRAVSWNSPAGGVTKGKLAAGRF